MELLHLKIIRHVSQMEKICNEGCTYNIAFGIVNSKHNHQKLRSLKVECIF